MIDLRILKRALFVGIVFQLVLVGCGAAWFWLRSDLLFGCMLVAGVAGMLYARDQAKGFMAGALGGAVAGAGGGLVAVVAASYLGEHPEIYIPYGVMVTTLIGAVGGMFGEMDARLRAYIIRKLNN